LILGWGLGIKKTMRSIWFLCLVKDTSSGCPQGIPSSFRFGYKKIYAQHLVFMFGQGYRLGMPAGNPIFI